MERVRERYPPAAIISYHAVGSKEYIFAEYNPSQHEPTEATISKALWDWRIAAPSDREHVISASKLALRLEFWMPFDQIEYTRRLGTWCDGIPLLVVEDIDRSAFRVSGVGYFPFEFVPFEVDFFYSKRRDEYTSKILFRFGTKMPRPQKQGFDYNRNVQSIYSQRPRDLEDWAVAVELTPLDA